MLKRSIYIIIILFFSCCSSSQLIIINNPKNTAQLHATFLFIQKPLLKKNKNQMSYHYYKKSIQNSFEKIDRDNLNQSILKSIKKSKLFKEISPIPQRKKNNITILYIFHNAEIYESLTQKNSPIIYYVTNISCTLLVKEIKTKKVLYQKLILSQGKAKFWPGKSKNKAIENNIKLILKELKSLSF